MQISLKWINELVPIQSINLNNLINKLTLGGFEVEDIIEVNNNQTKDTILEISSTANRSDSLSIQGISAEIMTLIGQPINISNYLTQSFDWTEKIKNKNRKSLDQTNCSMFTAITVKNVNTIHIPKWLKIKLINSGLTVTDTLLDFQNYILLETGYPIAIYDLEKIYKKLNTKNFILQVENSSNHTNFNGLNGISYPLNKSISLIKANELPLSIAGIIENDTIAYCEPTKSLLIEGSIFEAAKIRQQSRLLSLRTDRSARYEKSLKNIYLIEALYRFISLLRISNPNLICKLHTSDIKKEKNIEPIFLHYQTIKEILGPIKTNSLNDKIYVSIESIDKYLTNLNFKFSFNNLESTWKVNIPPLRSDDITREIDLIEEIGRLHGFNNFLTILPKVNQIGEKDKNYQTRKKITSCLLNLGLNELIHYSLVSNKTFIKNEIKLVNPLLLDYSNLRSSLLPNLIITAHENIKQSNLILEGFEYGHVFSDKTDSGFHETEKVAGILGGKCTKYVWSEKSKMLSWFEAKGKIEKLFKQLNISTQWVPNKNVHLNKIFHSYRSAQIYSEDNVFLGMFGQISPLLTKELSLPSEIYLFEFSLQQIQRKTYQTPLVIYNKYSVYPKIVKDLSFIIKQNILFNDIQNFVYSNGTKFLYQVILIDEYKGQTIPINYTSLCLQLIFYAKNKTLKNKDVDFIIKNIELALEQKFNVILRN